MNSVNKKEIEKFSKMAAEWWDPSGKFKPLHKFNPIRIRYIKENIISSFKLKSKKKPLDKINILDIGCGGGLLSEPMTRLGANVTGIDASSKNINIAKLHAKKNKLKINYLCSSPEKLKIKKKFDVILNMEIVEHVEDINFFINYFFFFSIKTFKPSPINFFTLSGVIATLLSIFRSSMMEPTII